MDTYPASPALLMCEADEQLNGKLQLLNENFEEYAVLSDVLRAVCSALNLGGYQGNNLMYSNRGREGGSFALQAH